ncbi:MAG: helix-turn-helix domain-containing protein [Elusimicrobiaceae bacterium]|nr:helix-turn-helix domain-containing protein [Elusimicrobiaceae bacterium]
MRNKKYNIRTLDQKEAIWKYYQKHGWKATAKKYKLSYQTFVHWRARIKSAGSSDRHPLARSPKTRTIKKETAALVMRLHSTRPNLSIAEIREIVWPKQHISRTTIWHILQGHWHPTPKK